jgi:hypothetical protein
MLDEAYFYYVDADTLWGRDFRAELRAVFEEHPDKRLYICHDCSAYRPDPPDWFFGYVTGRGHEFRCFGNSGTFVMRNRPFELDWRLEKAVPLFNRHRGMWPDQDVLNYMYTCEEKYLLPPEWNNHANCLDSLHHHRHALGDAILHHGHNLPFREIPLEWEKRVNTSIK